MIGIMMITIMMVVVIMIAMMMYNYPVRNIVTMNSGPAPSSVTCASRCRDSASTEFNALKKELAKLVMEEQMRYTETEIKGYTAD